eukprot:scaffold306754_cov24-Tisochrysis_lutea.AAC.1
MEGAVREGRLWPNININSTVPNSSAHAPTALRGEREREREREPREEEDHRKKREPLEREKSRRRFG